MRYQNMEVKQPIVEDLSIKPADLLNAWNQKMQYQKQLEIMLSPAVDAIKSYHYKRHTWATCDWDQMEICQTSSQVWEVVFVFTSYYPNSGEDDHESHCIPIEAVLGGATTMFAYFDEKKRKEQEESKRMGERREAGEKEKRRAEYEKLRQEFDPNVTAIVKAPGA